MVRWTDNHLKKVFEDSELDESSVIRSFRTTATDGKNYDTKHYNLSAIIAVGYRSRTSRLEGRVTPANILGLGAHRVCFKLAWLPDRDVHTHKPKEARHGS